VLPKGYEVLGDKGSKKTFTTAQGLLAELTGHPTGRHWSLERYFRLEETGVGQANVLDLFPPSTVNDRILSPLARPLISLRNSPALSVPSAPMAAPVSVVMTGPQGIDLLNRSHEVRKLLFAGYGRRIFAGGYNPDDVLQEVYQGLLVRNQGKCPWDPSKGSFGHYVHMVCGCVFSNMGRKQRRRDKMEQVGLSCLRDGEFKSMDVAEVTNIPAPETAENKEAALEGAAADLTRYILDHAKTGDPVYLAIAILPHVHAGEARKDIAERVGVSMPALSRAISYLRKSSLAWKDTLYN